MFIGHYGVSLAAKRWAPGLSLGWTFLAVQLLDVLFAIFVLTGIERLAIVPGFTAYNPYDLIFMPYTHSLVGALVWTALTRRSASASGTTVTSRWPPSSSRSTRASRSGCARTAAGRARAP